MHQSENTVQSPKAVPMASQRRRLCVNIEAVLGECHGFAWSIHDYSSPSDGLVLGQRRRRLTGIEPAMGCDAGRTLTRDLVGRPTSSVRGTSYASIEWLLASTGDGGGRNTRWKYILTCLFGSFLNYFTDFTNQQSLIISWIFRTLVAHVVDQYTVMFKNLKPIFCL